MPKPGFLAGKEIDSEFLRAVRRSLRSYGFEEVSCEVENGVLTIKMRYLIGCVDDGFVTWKERLDGRLAYTWMQLGDVPSFLRMVLCSYFSSVSCSIRDEKVILAPVESPDDRKKRKDRIDKKRKRSGSGGRKTIEEKLADLDSDDSDSEDE